MKNWKLKLLVPICSLTALSCLPIVSCNNEQVNVVKREGITVNVGEIEEGKDLTITYKVDSNYYLSEYGIYIHADKYLLVDQVGFTWNPNARSIRIYSSWVKGRKIKIDLQPCFKSNVTIDFDESVTKVQVKKGETTTAELPINSSTGGAYADIVGIITPESIQGDGFDIVYGFHIDGKIETPSTTRIAFKIVEDAQKVVGSLATMFVTFWSSDFTIYYGLSRYIALQIVE